MKIYTSLDTHLHCVTAQVSIYVLSIANKFIVYFAIIAKMRQLETAPTIAKSPSGD